MKKTLSLLLCTAMLFAALSACGGVGEDVDLGLETGEPSPGTSEPPEVSPEATEEPDGTRDWQKLWKSRDMDELVLTVDGSEVLWDEFFYWIYMNVSSFEATYGQMEYEQELSDGLTYGDYLLSIAEQYAVQYHALVNNAAELGVELTGEDREYLDEQMRQFIAGSCGEDATDGEFEEYLSTDCLTRRVFDFMNETSMLHQRIWIDLYGLNGGLYPEADALAWGNGMEYATVKHILILTQDEEGNALGEEQKAEKLAESEALLEQLRPLAGTEAVEAEFDRLMQENSEDPGLASYPDGYCYVPGTMYAEFEDAAAALGDYEVSDIVESTSGYHIILRLPLSVDDVLFDYGYSLRHVAAQLDFNSLVTSWVEEAELEATDLYKNFNLADFLAGE